MTRQPSAVDPDGVLAARDRELLLAIARGCSAAAAGAAWGWSPRQAQQTMRSLRWRLGARTNVQAVCIAIRRGLI